MLREACTPPPPSTETTASKQSLWSNSFHIVSAHSVAKILVVQSCSRALPKSGVPQSSKTWTSKACSPLALICL
jgi:hypothetical protein